MDIDNIVKLLRDPIDYKKICIDENNFLHKCILCKKFLKATEWSSIIEKYLKYERILSGFCNSLLPILVPSSISSSSIPLAIICSRACLLYFINCNTYIYCNYK